MTLLEGRTKQTYKVLETKEPQAIERRLEALGLISGTPITILNRKRQGAVIVKVRGTRFAMGREIAKGIIIAQPDDTKEKQGEENE